MASRATWARWLIRGLVSGTVIAILLSFISLDAIVDAIRRVSIWTWVISIAIFFGGHYLNAIKLRLLIGPANGEHLTASCVRAQYAGLVANLSLPGLAGGDLVRAVYLAPSVGIARVTVASVVDRLIDTSTVVMLVVVALPFAGVPPPIGRVVEETELWLGAGLLIAAVAAGVAWRFRKVPVIREKLETLRSAFVAHRYAVTGAVLISITVQSAFVLINVWLARQVGVTTAVAAFFVAWPLSKLIAILPISLGGLGVREAALVSLLVPYGAQSEAVLASSILWQGILIVTGFAGLMLTQLLPRATESAMAAEKV